MQWLINLVLESLKGMIVMWSGAIVDIPTGWHLCDGTEGTPDLRRRFVVGAGSIFDPGDTGGTTSHLHDFSGNGHTHAFTGDNHKHGFFGSGHSHTHDIGAGIQSGSGINTDSDEANAVGITDNGQAAGTTDVEPAGGTTELVGHSPPYYALAYIMKV